jgi:predicted enzyme related to lactoylglutathione lyase
MITDIAFTAYPSADVAVMRAWYEKMLGLKFSEPFTENGVEKYAESQAGNGYFSLMTHEWMEREPGSASGIVFEVDDIEKAVQSLRASGVEVEDIYETPVCKVTSLSDLEGNKVSLHQRTAP